MSDLPIEELLPRANYSIYKLVSMASKRALELSDGKRCLAENIDTEKFTTMALHEIAQGRIWSGDKALELGLVDNLGDLEEAIKSAARLAKVDDYSTWYVEPEMSTQQKIMKLLTSEVANFEVMTKTDPISMVYRKLEKEASFLANLNDPHHAYVICTSCLLEP